jgi:hypothetical protein
VAVQAFPLTNTLSPGESGEKDNRMTQALDLGPVEYMVIDFPGNRFNGDIAPAIAELVDRGMVRILDLVFVKKDSDGSITSFEYDELEEGEPFAAIDGEADGMLSDEDVLELAETIPDNSSALFVVWEDLWAADLSRAIRSSGGELVGGGRIPYQLLQEVVEATGSAVEGAQS